MRRATTEPTGAAGAAAADGTDVATEGAPPSAPLLSVRDLVVDYGRSRAVSEVSFEVPAGSVLAVLGTNGAGKSTVGSAISGLVAPTRGRIELDGRDITSWPAHRVARRGVTHVLEGRGVFPGLTVAENLRLSMSRTVPKAQRAAAVAQALETFPALAERRRQPASTLSGGERQMLALARVLAVPPRLLVADEPSLGLAPKLVDLTFDALRRASEAGVTVVLVEQYIERALELADEALILRRGRLVWSGRAEEAGSTVLDEYLGVDEAAAAAGTGAATAGAGNGSESREQVS